MKEETFSPLIKTVNEKDVVNKYNRFIRKRIYEEMCALLEDTEYSEEERVMGAKCYGDVLYWMVLQEERING